MSAVFDKVAVLGLGLLGGSVALAARRRGAAKRVAGATRSAEALERALRDGAVDETIESFANKQLTGFDEFNGLNQLDQDSAVNQSVLELKNRIIELTEQPILNHETVLNYTHLSLNKFTTCEHIGER